MRNTNLLLLLLICVSCNGGLEVKSSIKQLIIPGISSAKSYVNYVFEIQNHPGKTKAIDSLVVVENGRCFRVNYSLQFMSKPKLLKEFTEEGIYKIEASTGVGNRSKLIKCIDKENKVILYYKEGTVQKQLKFTSFEEKTKRRR